MVFPCSLVRPVPFLFLPIFPTLGVISRRQVDNIQKDSVREILKLTKPTVDPGTPSLQDTSSLAPLKRCRPGGMLVNNEVKRLTRTKKYTECLPSSRQ